MRRYCHDYSDDVNLWYERVFREGVFNWYDINNDINGIPIAVKLQKSTSFLSFVHVEGEYHDTAIIIIIIIYCTEHIIVCQRGRFSLFWENSFPLGTSKNAFHPPFTKQIEDLSRHRDILGLYNYSLNSIISF